MNNSIFGLVWIMQSLGVLKHQQRTQNNFNVQMTGSVLKAGTILPPHATCISCKFYCHLATKWQCFLFTCLAHLASPQNESEVCWSTWTQCLSYGEHCMSWMCIIMHINVSYIVHCMSFIEHCIQCTCMLNIHSFAWDIQTRLSLWCCTPSLGSAAFRDHPAIALLVL